MPELPEVETVRRSLEACLVGRAVRSVELRRADIVTGQASPRALLARQTVASIERLGKQLAIVGNSGRIVCVHLGMSGSLRHRESDVSPAEAATPHTHVVWRLVGGGVLAFHDPRRFGGIWTFPQREQLVQRRWSQLGPDALTIAPRQLHARLSRSHRPLKAALLDQQLVAGLGNIYVDELLYACRLHPATPADALPLSTVQGLVRRMRQLLGRAITAGGSTLRDYVDAAGRQGGFQMRHQVYGRGGEPCRRCRATLQGITLAGRTTVYCPRCQTI